MIEPTTHADINGGMVVGHDGSTPSTKAVRWAARLADRLGTPLHLVRTWTLSSAPRPESASHGYVPSMAEFEQAVLDELEQDRAEPRPAGGS